MPATFLNACFIWLESLLEPLALLCIRINVREVGRVLMTLNVLAPGIDTLNLTKF